MEDYTPDLDEPTEWEDDPWYDEEPLPDDANEPDLGNGLKPCPFCGSDVTIEVSENGKAGAFVCTSGSVCIGSGLLIGFVPENRDSSIAAWNTRASLKGGAE